MPHWLSSTPTTITKLGREHIFPRNLYGIIHCNLSRQSLVTPDIEDLRAQKLYPCLQTCNKWIAQFGHVKPKFPTGNHHAICKVRDENLVQLALFWTINPMATFAEIRAYLYNLWGGEEPLYLPSQIVRAKNFLGISRTIGSTTCFRAYLPTNLATQHNYFNLFEPHGILNTPICNVIDLDEAGMKVEHCNCKYGKCLKLYHVDSDGAYNWDNKQNLLLAILGDDTIWTNSWMEMWEEGGMNLFRLYNFVHGVIIWLGNDRLDHLFCFVMDNLNIRHNPAVLQIIHDAGHQYVFHALYCSCNGAIEYVFYTIHGFLLYDYPGREGLDNLENAIENIIQTKLGGFS